MSNPKQSQSRNGNSSCGTTTNKTTSPNDPLTDDIDLLKNDKTSLSLFLTSISIPVVGKEGSDKFVSFMMQSLRDEKDVYRGCITINKHDAQTCRGYNDCPSLPRLELSVKVEADNVVSMVDEDDHSSSTTTDKEGTKARKNNTKSKKKSKNSKPTDYKKIKSPCLCDSNPYCLASLGGVVTCVLYERSKNEPMGVGNGNKSSDVVDLSEAIKNSRSVTEMGLVNVVDDSEEDASAVACVRQKQTKETDRGKSKDMEIEEKGTSGVVCTQQKETKETNGGESKENEIDKEDTGVDSSVKKTKETNRSGLENERNSSSDSDSQQSPDVDKPSSKETITKDPSIFVDKEIIAKQKPTDEKDLSSEPKSFLSLKDDKQISKQTGTEDSLTYADKQIIMQKPSDKEFFSSASIHNNGGLIESSDKETISVTNINTASNEEISSISSFNISLVPINIPDNSAKISSQLRFRLKVPCKKILQHIELYIPSKTTQHQAIETIKDFHNSFFVKPESSPKNLYISTPPGIENLGATCYLNSFLQCLAHNPAFIQSIASWKQISMKTPMLEKLQHLLLCIRYGPNHSISAKDFASTLNLDSDLMQDPNEFARLLLDRMQELFAKSEKLKDVLPSLFQGVIENSIICRKCGNASVRQESFMEFMVPLQAKTLKECIDIFKTEEEMKGDNQYSCSYCKSLQDATRSWEFKKLPPVMNIQVARYAYNYQYGTKQKVMRELSLNTILHLNASEYQLVGVLNHVGTSANGGHYIAHTMEWITGLWFECNDEQVTYLPNGSPAAYVDKPRKGSTDAYHMFYVEKKYLSNQILDQISNNFYLSAPTLKPILDQREETFKSIHKMKTSHRKHTKRLEQQKNVMLSQVFPGLMTDVSMFVPNKSDDAIWIDRDLLCRIVSCNNHDVWETREMTHKILCTHKKGLHPRRARQGKLITKSMYKAIASTVSFPQGTLVITPYDNLRCDYCEIAYEKYLSEKIRKFIILLQIYYEFELTDGTSNEEQQLPYAVSRKFVSDVKKYTQKKMKQIVSSVELQMNGIDSLDLKEILEHDNVEDVVTSENDVKNSTDSFDPEVNSNILCTHGNMTSQYISRKIRSVSASTWEKIKTLFPKAIDVSNVDCTLCQIDEDIGRNAFECLKGWSADVLSNGALKSCFQKKDVTPNTNAGDELYLVPSQVVKDWRFCVDFPRKKKMASLNWRDCLPVLFQSFFQEQQPEEELGILCSAHSKTQPFPPYVDWYLEHFKQSKDVQDSLGLIPDQKKAPSKKSSPVEIMPTSLYKSFVMSLEMLHDIFVVSHEACGSSIFSSENFSMEDALSPFIVKITFCEDQLYTVDPPICEDSSCFQKELYEQSTPEVEVIEDYMDVDKDDTKKSNKISSGDEEKSKASCTIQIDEVTENIDLESLAELYSTTENNVFDAQDSTSLRRSSRKRKSRDFFSNSVSRFNISFDFELDSLAKIRLLLYEKHGKSPLNQELCLCLKSTFLSDTNTTSPILFKLSDTYNNLTIPEIISNYFQESGLSPMTSQLSPSSMHCIYLRYTKEEDYYDEFESTACDKKPRKKKINKQQREALEASLIDSLMNCIGIDPAASNIGKRKAGSAETGFVGTLLQSSIQEPSSPNVVEVL